MEIGCKMAIKGLLIKYMKNKEKIYKRPKSKFRKTFNSEKLDFQFTIVLIGRAPRVKYKFWRDNSFIRKAHK